MEKKRIYLFDNIKFLLILSVVFGHFIDYSGIVSEEPSFESAFIFIYSFHMPLFIYIGGLFFKEKDIASKVASFLSIEILLVIALYITSLIRNGAGSLNLISIYGVSWYMFAMGAFLLITYVTRNVDRRFLLIIAIILACFAGYSNEIGDKFVLSRLIVFYPFYLAGVMTDKNRLEELAKKKWLKLLSAAIIIIWLALCIKQIDFIYDFRPLLTGRNPFSTLKKAYQPYGGLYRLLHFAISALLCFAVICISPIKKIPVITMFGGRTVQVYFWHSSFIYFIMMIPAVQEMLKANERQRWLFVLLGIPLTFLLSLKPFAFPCNLIMKYSKSKELIKKEQSN